MPQRKRLMSHNGAAPETDYEYEVRTGMRHRDPMLIEAMRRANAAGVVAVIAVALALIGWILP